MAVIGIDLGTTNTLAAYRINGENRILKNSLGDSFTPSAVGLSDSGELIVGKIAAERLISHPNMTVAEFKRSMGLRVKLPVGNTAFSPEELSAAVLRKICDDAEAELGEKITEAVISVPAYFDDYRRGAVKNAAAMAGIYVERLINEPSAAAIAYQACHGFADGTFMVIDFGGGTLDVSVVDAFDGVTEILAVSGDNCLGGKDFNEVIAQHFCRENSINPDSLSPEKKAVLYRAAEACKKELTEKESTVMTVSIGDTAFTVPLDSNKLIEISSAIFERFAIPVKKALRDSKCSIDDINGIVLVGGSCRMPTVKAFIRRITGKEPCTGIDPDTAIAQGAAVFAAMKERREEMKNIILTDICPFSLGTAVLDPASGREKTDYIIERNAPLPSSFERRYYAASNGQSNISIRLYQGESIWPERNLYLGSLELRCPPTPKGSLLCSVRLTYDINGILAVDVTVNDGKLYSRILLSGASALTDAEVNASLKKMSALKLSPRDKEENMLLIAQAERLTEELTGDDRRRVSDELNSFLNALDSSVSRDIRITRQTLADTIRKYEDE